MSGIDKGQLGLLDEHMARMVHEGEIAGTSLVVFHDGEVVHQYLIGMRDRERAKPVTEDTIFRVASMTKPIASLALMQLYERGLFRLGDAVSIYIPEFAGLKAADSPAGARPMNMRDVLTHQTGLGTAFGAPGEGLSRKRDGTTLRDMIERLAGEPLMFAPGTRWSYGISTDVVGYLVEVLSGKSFELYLRDHIFEPLGMHDTGFSLPRENAERLAASYAMGDKGLELLDDPEQSPLLEPATYFSGAGGLVSTMDDYQRFAQMLLGRGTIDGVRVIGRQTLHYMLENHLPENRTLGEQGGIPAGLGPGELNMDTNGFGLGFSVRIKATPGDIGSLGEHGWYGAMGTIFWVDPANDLAVIFMSQRMFSLLSAGLWGPVTAPLRQIVYSALE